MSENMIIKKTTSSNTIKASHVPAEVLVEELQEKEKSSQLWQVDSSSMDISSIPKIEEKLIYKQQEQAMRANGEEINDGQDLR